MRCSAIRSLVVSCILAALGVTAASATPAVPHSSPFGPGNGRITGLVADSESGLLYASCEIGGVFQSADQGRSWSGPGHGLANRRVLSIALGPSGKLYAASEKQGRVEVLGSLDRGRTWTTHGVLNRDTTSSLLRLALVPGGGPDTLYLAEARELWKSTDRGGHWTRVLHAATYLNAVAAGPGSSEVYVGTAAPNGKLLHSVDGGATWTALQEGLPAGAPIAVTDVAVSSSQPPRIYVGIGSYGLFASADGGATWRQADPPFGTLELLTVAVDAEDSATVYAAYRSRLHEPFQVRVSRDGGTAWRSGGLLMADSPPNGGARILAAGSTVYATGDIDLAASTDHGETWPYRLRGGAGPVETSRIRFAQDDPTTMYALVGWRAFKSRDGGRTWTSFAASLLREGKRVLRDLACDPAHPATLYAAGELGVFKSSDGGDHWRASGPAARHLAMLSGSTVLAGDCGVLRTADAGTTWTEVLSCQSQEGAKRSIEKILPDPLTPDTVYAAVTEEKHPAPATGQIYRSRDGGKTWAPIVSGARVMALSPRPPATLYVVQGDLLLASEDGGDTFRQTSRFGLRRITAEPVADLLVDGTALYAATRGYGLLRSTDGGAVWVPLGSGDTQDPETGVPEFLFSLTPDPAQPGVFYAATGGALRRITVPAAR